jgi:DNA-binding response OmpR family regulator
MSHACRSKILVVDDERGIVSTLKISLESDNYIVIEAYTGDGAIRKARKEAPDLILLDIMLPDMTGYEICNRIRKDPLTKSIPVIMLTGMSGAADKMAGLDLGADDYITKPFDLNEIKVKIHNALANSIDQV